ncbi:MAG: magnesium chelatase [Thermotogae bacterium]|nr:MAG: magnesium chelatase [Thermotogota bacterium]
MATLEMFARTVIDNISKVIVGKNSVAEKILATILSGGHVLLNDVPGVGKTMMARALAVSLGLDFNRIQCTPDLLPTDITGLNILNIKRNEFIFKKGPIFTDVLLVDEINRATPRTQSALLQAMAEQQVTIDGSTHKLSEKFFVIATQNPVEFEGTFPLPEAQLDRFSVQLCIGYPQPDQEITMLKMQSEFHPIDSLKRVLSDTELLEAREIVKQIHTDDSILEYIVKIVSATRDHEDIAVGSSPRGAIALRNLSRALAALKGRDFVLPDDVKSVAIDCLAHRIILKPEARLMRVTKQQVIADILNRVEVPIKA